MPEFVATPGQTVGPFFHYGLLYPGDRELVPLGAPGSLVFHGCVYDGAGAAVPDGLVEIRQADAAGRVPAVAGSRRRAGSPFTGWGRSSTDRTGRFWFSTVAPTPPSPGGAAFFAVVVFARGLGHRLFTRAYLPGAQDALLASLPADQARTLLATGDDDGNLRFDIHLQGAGETVMLTFPRLS